MPTLDQAARQLGISEKTLRKWMRLCEPPVTPVKHRRDGRYRVITPEEVERVRAILAERPGARPTIIPSYNCRPCARRQSEQETVSDASPTVTHAPRQRAVQRATFAALPEGMMSKEDASRLHGVPTTTLRRWCAEGRVETTPGQYPGDGGRYGVVDPLTARGLAQLYQLASHRPDFQECPGCPHSERDGGEDGETPEA